MEIGTEKKQIWNEYRNGRYLNRKGCEWIQIGIVNENRIEIETEWR